MKGTSPRTYLPLLEYQQLKPLKVIKKIKKALKLLKYILNYNFSLI